MRTAFRKTMAQRFPTQYAHASGSYGWYLEIEGDLRPLPEGHRSASGRSVVLVHGLDEPGILWRTLRPVLTSRGNEVYEFRYPDDQPVSESAAFFARNLGVLREAGVREVAVIAHSMGCLVTRELLTGPEYGYATSRKRGVVPQVSVFIMLAPPNHGSPLARFRVFTEMRDQLMHLVAGDGSLLGGLVDGAGEAKIDLLPDSEFMSALNARPLPPDVAITIIAGIASPIQKGELRGALSELRATLPEYAGDWFPDFEKALESVADGVGDGAISVDSARLEGVDDFVEVSSNHFSMIRNVTAASDREPPAIPIILERLAAVWGE